MKYRINTKIIDEWTLIHFIIAFFLAMLLTIIFHSLATMLFVGMVIIIGWEIIEKVIKRYYDFFNIPFGRKSVLESPENSLVDIIAGMLGLLLFVFVMLFY